MTAALSAQRYLSSEDSYAYFTSVVAKQMLPASALEVRTSAHYLEVSRRYTAMMTKALAEKREQILAQRAALSRKEQLTKFAHPSYQYVPMKNEQ